MQPCPSNKRVHSIFPTSFFFNKTTAHKNLTNCPSGYHLKGAIEQGINVLYTGVLCLSTAKRDTEFDDVNISLNRIADAREVIEHSGLLRLLASVEIKTGEIKD